mgnify:CR=1 FL=1
MSILIFLKKKIEGSIFDKILRYSINFISPCYYAFTKKIVKSKKIHFVFICYGGLGDCVLTLPFLLELSSKYKVSVFIEEKFKDINCLLNENIEVRSYTKKNLLSELKFFGARNSNFILIQQSPIMEFILFNLCLQRPTTIGFIYTQNLISCEGIDLKNKKIISVNKISKYKSILKIVSSIENKIFSEERYKNFDNINKIFDDRNMIKQKYFLISPTKNHNWNSGFLELKTYANFLIKISLKTSLVPVIIGSKEDSLIINKIINYIPKEINYLNLVGKTTIKNLISLICGANFVVANDNGIHHLSNFLNTRTLTLYNFSSYKVYDWSKKTSKYIFNPVFQCMPCVGNTNGPFDNYPFKCPWFFRCKDTIKEDEIIRKIEDENWIN